MDFKTKYLKYKSKYLQLKKQLGGDKAILDKSDKINLFNVSEMEKYLNPIYGLILCENGYIPNNFYLKQSKFKLKPELDKILSICREIPGSIQPSLYIMNLKPVDFGRYIAIKYINMKENFIRIRGNGNIDFVLNKNIINEKDNKSLRDYINLTDDLKKFKSNIPIDTDNKPISFHIILYCMWWTANNHDGIVNYYKGINDVFKIINEYLPADSDKQYFINTVFKHDLDDKLNNINNIDFDNKFEKNILILANKQFNVYNQEQTQNFCNDNSTYPDCGETTSRNLINLICYSGDTFNIDELNKYKPISQLINYYETFTNFNHQSNNSKFITMDDKSLNARDAWSYLIIKYANKNINFVSSCTNQSKTFELNAGLAKDNSTSNFFQLIKNLLGIEKWDEINDEKSKYINKIIDNTNKQGFGYIDIEHKKYNKFKIHCNQGHYYMDNMKTEIEKIDRKGIDDDKLKEIDILLKIKTILNKENYLWMDINSEILVEYINNSNTEKDLRINLFKLSFTNKYDSDTRRRIEIDVDEDYFNDLVSLYNSIYTQMDDKMKEEYKKKIVDKLGEYTYKSKNFNFVDKLYFLEKKIYLNHLNHKLNEKNEDDSENGKIKDKSGIYLKKEFFKYLKNITSIGYNFMSKCENFKTIDLSELSNIKSIGNNFMVSTALTILDLSCLTNLESIGDDFMNNCRNLKTIFFPENLKYIGNYFMRDCISLTTVDLSCLTNLESIGDDFMKNCIGLKTIFLPKNIKSIGNDFTYGCTSLTPINLSDLSNLESIGDNFIKNYKDNETIDLSCLSKLESIGNDFMKNCTGLKTIFLPKNIKSIGNNFMRDCKSLTTLDLSYLTNLESIGDDFMYKCTSLKTIYLPKNIKSIGNDFTKDCTSLTPINLADLSNLESIGNFIKNYTDIETIDLSCLSKLESIGNYFMHNYTNLKTIIFPKNIKTIGNNFIYNCISLTTIDLSCLTNLESIGNNFMAHCISLTTIFLPKNIKYIGFNFMYHCRSLTTIDLSCLTNLESIGNNFMQYNTGLTTIFLPKNIKTIGNNFMTKCTGLTTIDLSCLTNLESIGYNFMNDCSNLNEIIINKYLESLLNLNQNIKSKLRVV